MVPKSRPSPGSPSDFVLSLSNRPLMFLPVFPRLLRSNPALGDTGREEEKVCLAIRASSQPDSQAVTSPAGDVVEDREAAQLYEGHMASGALSEGELGEGRDLGRIDGRCQ